MSGPLWPLGLIFWAGIGGVAIALAALAVGKIRAWAEPYTSRRIYTLKDREQAKKP